MEAAHLVQASKSEGRKQAPGVKSANAHILLVDDDVSLLRLLGMRLESRGYRVTTAESGAEALRRLDAISPDIVLSDLRMDEMDGMALFQA
ncbi:MAG: response regulator, partial [Halomonadaceae bacterium]|nr:response regulator [Halomonadaceae bacterium]